MSRVTWTGSSGLQYQFETFPIGTRFNHVSGVYVACRLVPFAGIEALYVGQAQSLADRLNSWPNNHDGLMRAAREGMSLIAARVVAGDAERLRVETDLRHGLNPLCNAQSVPSNALLGVLLNG